MASRELRVEIIGDASSLNKALGSVSKNSSKVGSSMKALGKVAAGAGLLIGAGFVATLKVGFEELAESQKVMAQTEAVLKSTGGAAQVSAKQVEAYASSMSAVSGVDDEVIQSGENMLLTFKNIRNETGKGNDIFKQSTQTLLDMSTALGTDMNKSAIQLGKALNDPIKGITALSRVGVTFTEGQKETIKSLVETGDTLGAQKIILKELNSEFGGSAEAYGKTLPGALSKARNAFEEIAGHIAERFLPALTKALDWVNSNWPQISKVVDQVADAIQNGLGQAVQTVRRNFETIKTVARTTFEGALTVARKLVDFFKTDFGQSVGVGLGAILAMKSAMGALGLSIGGVGKALGLLSRNPMWALLIPVGLLVGELTSNYIKNKIAAEQLAAATRDAGASMDELKTSLNNLKQSAISEAQAKLSAEKAAIAVTVAQKAYNAVVTEFGPKSKQAKAALVELRQAKLDSRQADLDLKTSTEAHIAAELKRAQTLQASTKTVMDLTAAAVKANGTFAEDETAARYASALRTLGDNASTAAGKLQVLDPAASVAKQKAAALADVAADLAEKLGRVPTHKEIIAEAKVRGLDKFFADVNSLVTSMANASRNASGAGFTLGYNFGTGVAAGIAQAKVQAVLAAIAMVAAVVSAAGSAAKARSPSRLFADEVGKPIAQGVAVGIMENTGYVSERASEMVRTVVKAASQAVRDAKAEYMEAFKDLAQAGIDAIAAKYKDWKPPSLLKAQREAEEREKARFKQSLVDARTALEEAMAGGDPAAIASAQAALDDLLFQQRQMALAKKAEQEQREHDASVRREQASFAKRAQAILDGGGDVVKKLLRLFADYDIAFLNAGKAWGMQMAAGLRAALKEVEKAADDIAKAVKDRTKPGSPAKKGPLSEFDMHKAGRQYGMDFAAGLASSTGAISSAAGSAAGAAASGMTSGGSFGGDSLVKSAGGVETDTFAPKWADPEIWAVARGFAVKEGQYENFMDAVASGSFASNAGLLDQLFRRRTRWNWEDWSPRLQRMFEMMSGPEGMSGRQVADYFGLLAKGGIVKSDGYAYLHANEAVVPLSKRNGMGGTTVNINLSGSYVGSEQQLARVLTPAIQDEMRRQKNRGWTS